MRSGAPLLLAAAAAMLAAAGPPASPRQAEIDRIVFDLCPQMLDGTLSLEDPVKVAAIGFTPTAPRETPGGKQPRAAKGEGAGMIVIAGHGGTDGMCGTWFGGPDNQALLDGVRKRAKKAGFKGGRPMRLGDGTAMYVWRREGRLLTLIAGNAGGEVAVDPATTIILMPSRD